MAVTVGMEASKGSQLGRVLGVLFGQFDPHSYPVGINMNMHCRHSLFDLEITSWYIHVYIYIHICIYIYHSSNEAQSCQGRED